MISGSQAINRALDEALFEDERVVLLGLGINDESGVFGTTKGLAKKYGFDRVRDVPISENALTGIVLGMALSGHAPVLTHQRVDFSLLSMDQIVNQIAKWKFMFGNLDQPLPIVIRMIVGRGWGQGPQHSQFLASVFAHIPGLIVVSPCYPEDMYGLLRSSIASSDPVIFIEHRWCHGFVRSELPKISWTIGPIDVRDRRGLGNSLDLTIFSTSYMTTEALCATKHLRTSGVNAFVVHVPTLSPLDRSGILTEAFLSRRVLVVDPGWGAYGFSAEILATISEGGIALKCPPRRLAISDSSCPTAPSLSKDYYPRAEHIYRMGMQMMGREVDEPKIPVLECSQDQPNPSFKGPF